MSAPFFFNLQYLSYEIITFFGLLFLLTITTLSFSTTSSKMREAFPLKNSVAVWFSGKGYYLFHFPPPCDIIIFNISNVITFSNKLYIICLLFSQLLFLTIIPIFLLFCAKKHQFPDASKLSHVINHALYYIISRLSNA